MIKITLTLISFQGREALPTPLALASPERSAVDEQSFKVHTFTFISKFAFTFTFIFANTFEFIFSFQMATNYLKAQFAMPHHTVRFLEDKN